MPLSVSLRCRLGVCSLSFAASSYPQYLGLSASEGAGILNRDAVVLPQTSAVDRLPPCQRCCPHLMVIHLQDRPMEYNQTRLDSVALQRAL